MDRNTSKIKHEGIVIHIDPERIEIMFVSASACASCHAEGVCSVSDIKEKEVYVPNFGEDYTIGEHVMLELQQALGFKAVYYAYVQPFLLVLIGLIVYTSLEFSELLSGLLSLSVLFPYYFLLYTQREKLEKKYSFKIRKIKNKF